MKTLTITRSLLLSFLFFSAGKTFSQLNQWTWIKGDHTINQQGVYGSIGISSAANKPGARGEAASWKDNDNNFWLYGGTGYGIGPSQGPMSDLWKYKLSTNEWTWVKGPQLPQQNPVFGTKGIPSASNTPGARQMSATWTDTNGNLWLFGGSGANFFNDLWKYDIVSNQWTWMSGDNTANVRGVYNQQSVPAATNKPGARSNAACWTDKTGNLWLFGGNGYAASGSGGRLGDLWKYNINNNEWTWMKGDSVIQMLSVYGAMNVSAVSNKPGARLGASYWIDGADNLWLFGGLGYASVYGVLNDLWKYNIAANEWIWVNGDSTVGHPSVYTDIARSNTDARPGAVHNAITTVDAAGNTWLFGGRGYTASAFGELNALWKYNMTSNQWSFVKGDPSTYVAGVYGTMSMPAETNKPGSREKPLAWTDSIGNLWLFGGENYPLNTTTTFFHNDLWKFSLVELLPVKLVSFNGVLQNKNVLLTWTAADETGFDHYEIEKSFNGISFKNIGNVKGINKKDYEFTDYDAIQPGVIYYRLKMVDIDGHFNYSSIIKFKTGQTTQFVLYPNPAKDFTQLKFSKNINGKVLVEIINAGGRLMQRNMYDVNGNGFVISTKGFGNGMYVVKIIFEGECFMGSLSVVR
ncbi:MAG: kelch repeat-containing protein [Ferruginibacter sp.]